MQSGDPSETLGVEAYHVVPLGDPIPHRVESMTTWDDLLVVGTTDSKLAAYRLRRDASGSSQQRLSLQLLHEVADSRRQAVRSLTVVGGRHLLALVGDAIVLYQLHSDPARPFELREVTALTGLKDVLSFHIKQQKGVLSLAALQRRRLTIYDATFAHFEFMVRETVTLPDGVRTFGWMGRSFMLGGRREYFLHHTASSSSAALYPTPRSGATPFILPMPPVPEVLVAAEGGAVRALLSDGGEVPGNARLAWSSPPVSASYEHPFLVTQHATGPHTLQVRLPLLTTLEAANQRAGCLLQCLDLPKLARMSQCCWVDYDCPMPTSATAAGALTRNPIVVADASGRLFLLERCPVAAQAEALAARSLFGVADLLCQLCPHEVHGDTLRRVVVAGAMHRFVKLRDYAGCFHELSRIEADARLAIQLFPGFLSAGGIAAQGPQLPSAPPQSVTVAALPALADYLQSRRVALLLQSQAASGRGSGAGDASLVVQLACVDRALVQAWCHLESEAPLLALLQSENWCGVPDTARVLKDAKQWVALTMLLEQRGDLQGAAQQLRELVTGGKADAAALSTSVRDALRRFLAAHPSVPAADDSYLPQSVIAAWAVADGAAGKTDVTASLTAALVGVSTALTFFRRRALASQHKLFAEHVTWLLGCLPPQCGVRVFFSAANLAQHATALRLLRGYADHPGCTPQQLLVVSYLHAFLADSRARADDAALYEQYWTGLATLLFANSAPPLSESDQLRYRSRLDEFLLTSTHIDFDAAERFFNAKAMKARCVVERAAVYRRQGKHRAAVEMFLHEQDDLAAARTYASSVRGDDGGAAFTALLELLLRPSSSAPGRAARVAEALDIMNTCEGVEAARVLPMLPDELPFAELSGFLVHAFRDATTAFHVSAMDSSVLSARLARAAELRVAERSRCAALDDGMVCPVCQRRLRPDTVLAVYPSGLVVHEGCLKDVHVCPATHRDFRHDAYSMLGNL